MRPIEETFGWREIDTAPLDEDLAVLVTDSGSAPYKLKNPCKRTEAGWVSSGKGTPLAVTPVKWKPYRPVPRR
jgi:hypothetical protein